MGIISSSSSSRMYSPPPSFVRTPHLEACSHTTHAARRAKCAAACRAWEGKSDEHPFLLDNVYDIVGLLDYLCSRPDVDCQRIGMTGKAGMVDVAQPSQHPACM